MLTFLLLIINTKVNQRHTHISYDIISVPRSPKSDEKHRLTKKGLPPLICFSLLTLTLGAEFQFKIS